MTKKIYWSLLLAIALAGGGMLSASLRYPWHTVSEQEIGNLSARLGDKPREVRFREWYEERAKLDTPRKVLNDTGTGLLALAATLAMLRLLTGFPLQDSRSPKWRWLFIVAYLIALAVQVPSSFWYYGLRQSRFDYPAWGDSIIIGVFQTFMACAVFAVVGCLLWWPFLAKSRFPATLYSWPGNQNRFNVIVSLGFGAFAALCLVAVPSEVRDGNLGGILMTLVLAYLFLSVRAGLVTRQAEKVKDRTSEPPVAPYSEPAARSPQG
jgi:hypothetical protein